MSKRRADDTSPVRTIFLGAGRTSEIHRHEEPAAWVHVVMGEIIEERWTRDPEGGFVHEQRRLKKGQCMAAPADVLHRITAVDDAAFVSSYLCDCGRACSAEASEIDTVMRLSRSETDREWATATVPGTVASVAELSE
jgi:hypothetical protein